MPGIKFLEHRDKKVGSKIGGFRVRSSRMRGVYSVGVPNSRSTAGIFIESSE